MPPLELDPRLALLPAEELSALLIAVSEVRQDAAASESAGEVIVAGKRYHWQLTRSAEPLEPTSTTVLRIDPTASEPQAQSPAPSSLLPSLGKPHIP